jgi:hypothetical protein
MAVDTRPRHAILAASAGDHLATIGAGKHLRALSQTQSYLRKSRARAAARARTRDRGDHPAPNHPAIAAARPPGGKIARALALVFSAHALRPKFIGVK